MAGRREIDMARPVSQWREEELLDGQRVNCFVVIFRTGGCSWARRSGCTMCGYVNDASDTPPSPGELIEQWEFALDRYRDEPYLKFFCSGSLLDNNEFPMEALEEIVKTVPAGVKKLLLESRPEYVQDPVMEKLQAVKENRKAPDGQSLILEIAMGLESSCDEIRITNINKGFSMKDYKRASAILKDRGYRVKTYLLLKAPGLSEGRAIDDAVSSITDILDLTDSISINPVNIQKWTPVEKLFNKGLYRPPWFWSLARVLERTWTLSTENGVRLMSAPTASGTLRGVHNCGKCDFKFQEAVKAISLGMMGPEVFQRIQCSCGDRWKDILDLEDIVGDPYFFGDYDVLFEKPKVKKRYGRKKRWKRGKA